MCLKLASDYSGAVWGGGIPIYMYAIWVCAAVN